MDILAVIKQSIHQIGIKEMARRTGISASTVSRFQAGLISPSFEVVEKLSRAAGYELGLTLEPEVRFEPRLKKVMAVLRGLQGDLSEFGVKHITIFGSVARMEDRPNSDLDLWVVYHSNEPEVGKVLKVEGLILEAFPGIKVDFVTDLTTAKGKRLKTQIDRDGRRAF